MKYCPYNMNIFTKKIIYLVAFSLFLLGCSDPKRDNDPKRDKEEAGNTMINVSIYNIGIMNAGMLGRQFGGYTPSDADWARAREENTKKGVVKVADYQWQKLDSGQWQVIQSEEDKKGFGGKLITTVDAEGVKAVQTFMGN